MTFVLPGFMKAGSTYIFDTIDAHPWIVPALRGFDYKEASCYTPEMLQNETRRFTRMQCYPFVEPFDHVRYGDGSIVYAPRRDTVKYLIKDNPDIKVIFSVRDPLERALSIHRFDYYALNKLGKGNINDCLEEVFALKPFLYWRSVAVNATNRAHSPEERRFYMKHLALRFTNDLQSLFLKSTPGQTRCYRVIFDSLYLPAIYHWAQYIKPGNIRVINIQRLQASKMLAEEKLALMKKVPIVDDFDIRDLFLPSTAGSSTILTRSSLASALKASNHRRRLVEIERRQLHGVPKTDLSDIDQQYLKYQFNALYR